MPGSKRQRELARRRAERQAARRRELAIRKRKQRLIVGASGVGVLVLILGIFFAVKSSNNKDKQAKVAAADASASASSSAAAASESAAAASASAAAAAPKPVACGATRPAAIKPQTFPSEPPLTIDPKKKYTATVKTSCGEVTIDLLADKAPTTVNSFNFLASKKFFDGSRCHRILTGDDSVLQCGDPTATGTGGPGYTFKDENLPTPAASPSASDTSSAETVVYPAGSVAMANSGPSTNGSQFFFVVKDSPFPPNYSIFGKVTKGQDVLDKLLAVGQAPGTDKPAQDMYIESFTVTAS